MKLIGLLSDTHYFLDDNILSQLASCDEIWHAGDFGNIAIAEKLSSIKPLKGIYGNIDGNDIRSIYPETLRWNCEGVDVLMIHIGGYPGKYSPRAKEVMKISAPRLFISGHSHILKIIYDEKHNCLHMNPGAAGNQGWHQMRTLVRFIIDGSDIRNCEVIELGKRAARTK